MLATKGFVLFTAAAALLGGGIGCRPSPPPQSVPAGRPIIQQPQSQQQMNPMYRQQAPGQPQPQGQPLNQSQPTYQPAEPLPPTGTEG